MYRVFSSKFGQKQKHSKLAAIATTVAISFVVSSASLSAAPETGSSIFDQDMLDAVVNLYGISEEQAVDRLAKESEAALALKHVKSRSLKSYAGSWFDASSMKLKVAIADSTDIDNLNMLDVDPVLVNYSLEELQAKLAEALNRVKPEQSSASPVVSSYIDYKSNAVVFNVNRSNIQSVQSELAGVEFSGLIQIEETEGLPTLSTGPVRGGDGIRNLTWQPNPGDVAPCSVGASVEDGFVTAGHCGFQGNSIGDSGNNSLGTVVDSAFDYDNPYVDAGYVETVTGWTPAAQVNGYTDGVFSISDEWAGMVEYPVGTTVCRYGQTSGGPHCGTVNQINLDQEFVVGRDQWGQYITQITLGVTRVSGSCSDDGDSGGTWVAGTGQIQGVNVGVKDVVFGDLCPITALWTYYQPIKDVVDEVDVTMLTSHGSNAPDITDVECPDAGVSTYGRYYCEVNNVDSQGEVSLQWTSSNGGSSTKTYLVKRCTPPSTISVALQATNPYGTDTEYFTFPCPTSNQ